jgi:hypothetical protein
MVGDLSVLRAYDGMGGVWVLMFFVVLCSMRDELPNISFVERTKLSICRFFSFSMFVSNQLLRPDKTFKIKN